MHIRFSMYKLLTGILIPIWRMTGLHQDATTGFVIRKSFGGYLKDYNKFTDSQVALFWINSREKPLKPWVRSRVIEINHLSETSKWHYIRSKNNIADIGTRKGVQVKDIEQNSPWING